MEKLTAFVSRFEGKKTSSSEDILAGPRRTPTNSPVFSSSHSFNIANILSNETGSRYRNDVRGENMQDSNVVEASKLATYTA